MAELNKKLLVFADDKYHDGHEADFRHALTRALDNIPYSIFEDISKTPENIFSAMVTRILFNDVVLLDGTPFTNIVPQSLLIQYGICYALDKKCMLVVIKNSSREVLPKIEYKIAEGYVEFDYYLDFSTQFKSKLLEWVGTKRTINRVKSNPLAVHSFIAFGVERWENPDLFEVISSFSLGNGWTPRIVSNIGSLSKLEKLAKAVNQRSFCIFCLDKNKKDPEEIFLGIGLAIGMGRPFLIIKHESVELPRPLSGYHGVIEFNSYSQLKDRLSRYEDKFLSDDVFEWEGATYNDLLSKLERGINDLPSSKLDEFESVLLTVNSVLDGVVAKPFALLGELYREKNYKLFPDNIELLIKAKEYYEMALNIQQGYQLYQNAVVAIDKHIQLIELIKEKKYRSIPILINLIGGELENNSYIQVKAYLLGVVDKLVEEKNYAHAISLLAAMQVHDKSEQIQKLIYQVLNLAPFEIIKALQDSQELIVELEGDKARIVDEVREKDLKLDKITREITISSGQLLEEQEKFEQIKKERDELNSKLNNISSQLSSIYEVVSKLGSEIESAKVAAGLGVIINFGYGWAIYKALDSKPYIVREGRRHMVEKGFPLISGDRVYDEDDVCVFEYLPRNAIVLKPNDALYSAVDSALKEDG